jgi:hypothetical protein
VGIRLGTTASGLELKKIGEILAPKNQNWFAPKFKICLEQPRQNYELM